MFNTLALIYHFDYNCTAGYIFSKLWFVFQVLKVQRDRRVLGERLAIGDPKVMLEMQGHLDILDFTARVEILEIQDLQVRLDTQEAQDQME